jgi:acyl-CoA hydrolase
MDNNPEIEIRPFNETNDPNEIAKNDNMISINNTLMVDLTAQVASEAIGYDQFSSTGGQLDFVRGSAMSKGGKSFLCLPSTVKSKDGTIASRIMITLPEGTAVTVPRSDV